MLKLNNLSKQFGTKKVLSHISLTVKPGEIAFLLGPSGVGKSTLLRILNDLETYDAGSVLLDTTPLDATDVGMVFQQFNLFAHMSVIDNIRFPLMQVKRLSHEDATHQAHTLLKRYGLEGKEKKAIGTLSGGQKQRLAIARSIAMKPAVICLDEPTSALDPMLTNAVAKAIQDLAQEGFIVLVASHDIALLEQLSCTIYLLQKHGTIAESAPSETFKKDPQAYPAIARFVKGG